MEKNDIARLREKYDLNNDKNVLLLYQKLQTGDYDLSSPEGRAFDDEVYERVVKIKKKQAQMQEAAEKEQLSKAGKKNRKSGKRGVVVLTKGQMQARKILLLILFFIMIGCLGYFCVYVYDAGRANALRQQIAHKKDNQDVIDLFSGKDITAVDKNGQQAPEILDEYKSLYSQNKNLIGWLKIADTNIDYPVMQTADNTYYLDHDINQKEDKNGTLFMDCNCDVLKPSMNLIIYGHNMRSGNMFGSLNKYKSEDYYKNHMEICFDSIYEKGVYEVMYVFNSKIYAKDEITFKYYQFFDAASPAEFDSNMRQMEEMSLYDTGVTAQYGDRLLTLSTCDYLENDSRFVVVAKKTN
ncbi:MAG: class B sortase [Lachnospiraceae bacterium]|nr:class B sortase [Lachnospiraceae bacterium]